MSGLDDSTVLMMTATGRTCASPTAVIVTWPAHLEAFAWDGLRRC